MFKKLIKIVKKFKRRGRGYASGKGGHTVGRGQKGQKSRGKGKPGILHEGGRVPVYRKLPKSRGRGFKPVREYTSISLKELLKVLERNNLHPKVITPKLLVKLGFKKAKDGFRVYGKAEAKEKFTFKNVKITKGVKESLNL